MKNGDLTFPAFQDNNPNKVYDPDLTHLTVTYKCISKQN